MSRLFNLVIVAGDDAEVVGHRTSALVGQGSRGIIRHPAVNASSSGVDPQDVLKAEVLPEPHIHHLHLRVPYHAVPYRALSLGMSIRINI